MAKIKSRKQSNNLDNSQLREKNVPDDKKLTKTDGNELEDLKLQHKSELKKVKENLKFAAKKEKLKADAKAKKAAEKELEKAKARDANARKWAEKVFGDAEASDNFITDGYVLDDVWNIKKCPRNVIIFLSNELLDENGDRVLIRKNEFTGMIEVGGKELNDEILSDLTIKVSDTLDIYRKDMVVDALNKIGMENKYHPIKECIEDLKWDGTPRVETFFIDRLGAPDTQLTREITFKWMFAMLKRVYEPGCVFDQYIIISDPKQGTGKSKTFEMLARAVGGVTANNVKTDIDDKDNVMNLNGCIIGLFDESNQIKYAALESFKKFVTTPELRVRLPYARAYTTYAVHCVYAATTNEPTFLTDNTSAYERRAWVLLCDGDPSRSFAEWDRLNNTGELQQVWAELRHWYGHQDDAPWEVGDNRITYLTEENTKSLAAVQSGVKTDNEDSELSNALETILLQLYTKDRFENAQDFINNRRWANDENIRTPLEIIPFDWLYEYVKTMVKGKNNRSERYVRQALMRGSYSGVIGEWEYGQRSYEGKRRQCVYRKKTEVPKISEEPKLSDGPKTAGRPKYLHEKVYEMTRDENALPDAEHSPMMEKIRAVQRGESVEPSRETPPAAPARKPKKKPLDANTRNWKTDDVEWEEVQL